MSDESRRVPDKVKRWAILLIAFGIFAAGVSNGYLAITKKLESDRIKAEKAKSEAELLAFKQKLAAETAKQEETERAKEAAAEKPKTWDTLAWNQDRKATIVTRYRNGFCQIKVSLEKFEAGEYLSEVELLDKDGFQVGRTLVGPYRSEEKVYMSLDDYNRIASVTAKAQLL